MTEPTDPQPQPVTNATTWAAAATAVTGAVLTILEVAGVITSGDRDQLWRVLATAIPTVVGMVATILAGLHARARVTPLARPKDAAGRPLVVHPAFYGQHAAAPADPLDDWPGAIEATASVPRPVKAAADPPPATYTIVQGDTLWALSQRFGVSVANLEAWNPDVVPTALRIGEVINLQPPDLQGQLDAARAEITRLTATVSGLQTSLTAATGRIASQLATIDEQAARIAELEAELHPAPAPAPAPAGTVFGINASSKGQHDSYAKLLPGVKAWRYYFQPGEPPDNPANVKDGYPLGPGEFYVISFKVSQTVDELVVFLRKLPTDRKTYVCWCHEPADQLGLRTSKKPAFTKAQYDDMYHRLRLAQRQVGDHIVIIAILEGIAFLAGNDPDDELPQPGDYDVIGVDPYFSGSIGQPWAKVDAVLDAYKAAADKRGKPWAVCEVGIGQGLTGQARLDALAALPGKLAARGALFVCYFLGTRNRIQWSLKVGDGSADAWTKATRTV